MDDVQEGLYFVLQSGSIALMQIDDNPQADDGILLVLHLQQKHRQLQEAAYVGTKQVVVGQPIEDF